MPGYLQQLLGVRDPLFAINLQKLERATGNQGIDVKLIGDIHEKAYSIMRQLGLDPNNTTNSELWAALHGTYAKKILVGADYVGLVTVDGVVSFNANDVKWNKNRQFAERTVETMRLALMSELVDRYRATGREVEAHIQTLINESGVNALNIQRNRKGNKQ